MTPPGATFGARSSLTRHRTAVRRRRLALATLVGVGALAVAIAVAMPLFRRAVNDLTLPLAYSDVIRQQAAGNAVHGELRPFYPSPLLLSYLF